MKYITTKIFFFGSRSFNELVDLDFQGYTYIYIYISGGGSNDVFVSALFGEMIQFD